MIGLKETSNSEIIELVRLSVDERARRKGLGKLLVAHFEGFQSTHPPTHPSTSPPAASCSAASPPSFPSLMVLALIEVAQARGGKKVTLQTLSALEAAVELYKSLGYTEENRKDLGGALFLVDMSKELK